MATEAETEMEFGMLGSSQGLLQREGRSKNGERELTGPSGPTKLRVTKGAADIVTGVLWKKDATVLGCGAATEGSTSGRIEAVCWAEAVCWVEAV